MKKALYQFIIIILLSQLSFAQKYPQKFESRGIGGGGALYVPSINPYNNDEIYISCDMSELFHSTNFGKNFEIVNFQRLQTSHQSKMRFTSNSQILYNVTTANDLTIPIKSVDGGKSFKALKGTPNDDQFQNIFVDSEGSKIVISFYGTIYLSLDGGDTFKKIHTCVNNGAGNILGGVFFHNNSIYLGTNDGLIYSEDNGSTFNIITGSLIPSDEAIYSFSGAYENGKMKLYCLTAKTKDIYVFMFDNDPGSYRAWDNAKNNFTGFCKGLYTFTKPDGQAGTWQKGNNFDANKDFMMWVSNAENDIDSVYLAGGSASNAPSVLRSIDGGANFSQVFLSDNNQNVSTGWSGAGGDRLWSYGEVALGFTVCPSNSQRQIITDFGFPHTSTDGGASWNQAYVNISDANPSGKVTPKGKSYNGIGIENTTCWQVTWIDKDNLFASFSDIKGIRSTDGGKSWNQNYTGHNGNSMYRLVQAPNGNLFAGTSNIHDMYQSTRLADNILDAIDTYGKIIYSTDKGSSWKDIKVFNHPVFWVALDPNDPNTMYASVIHYSAGKGIGGIYVTKDLNKLAAATWTKLTNPPRTEGHPAAIVVLKDGNVVCTYSGRRSPSFTASSGCFIYNPNTNAWTDVSDNGMKYWTKDIIIDPNDATQNTWYVAVFSGWGGAPNGLGGLYKTTNRGQKWTKINIFDRVTSITFDPSNSKQAYLTTEQLGLWFSENMDLVVPTFNLVQSYNFRQPERVYFNPFDKNEVWVSSFGNGMNVGNLGVVAPTEFTVSATSQGKGTITPKGDITVQLEHNLNFTFSPDVNSILDYFEVDNKNMGRAQSYQFSSINSNHSVKAYFKDTVYNKTNYTISVTSNAGGIVQPSGVVNISEGADTTFNFISSKGYVISKVKIDGIDETTTPTNYTFKNVKSNHTLNVTFASSNSVEDFEELESQIYPNPVKEEININNEIYNKYSEYAIYNTNGDIVKDFNILKSKIQILDLANGVYYILLKSDKNNIKGKMKFVVGR